MKLLSLAIPALISPTGAQLRTKDLPARRVALPCAQFPPKSGADVPKIRSSARVRGWGCRGKGRGSNINKVFLEAGYEYSASVKRMIGGVGRGVWWW